jgi:hypothetical protein
LDEEKDDEGKSTGIPKLPEEEISISNFDQTISRIEETVKQTTNPQLMGLSFSKLLKVDGSDVYLIGIPKTKSLPTMITYNNLSRFYKRKANGKYLLDTYELYETFTQIGILEERINDFIKQRQVDVVQNKFWQKLGSLRSVIMHMIPLSFFNSTIENFSSPVSQKLFINCLKVPGLHSYSYRYCFEGFHLYSNRDANVSHEIIPYNLLFRNATIETFTNESILEMQAGKPILYSDDFLKILKEQLQNNFDLFKALGIDFPFYLSIKFNNTTNLSLVDNSGTRILGSLEHGSLPLPTSLLVMT